MDDGPRGRADDIAAPEVTIEPSNGMRSVRTIPAIKALVACGAMGLLQSKRLVERMVVDGSADTGLGRFGVMMSEPGALDLAMGLQRALADAGVLILVDGMPLIDWLDRPPDGPSAGP